MVWVHGASHGINCFSLGTSERAAVLGVLTHPHVLPETLAQKTTCRDKVTIYLHLWEVMNLINPDKNICEHIK